MLTRLGKMRDTSTWWLVLGVIGLSVGAASLRLMTERASRDIETASAELVESSGPAIEALAALRAAAYETQLHLAASLQGGGDGPLIAEVHEELERLGGDVTRYLDARPIPDEQEYRERVRELHGRFREEVVATLALRGERRAADEAFVYGVQTAGRDLVAAAMETIAFHARYSADLAVRIAGARNAAIELANVLTFTFVALGAAAAIVAWADVRRRRQFVQAAADFHETRASELEHFAGRVAHDIRNPLGAARLGTDLLLTRAREPGTLEVAERISRSLERANEITEALFEFARSGARPDPGARTELRDAVTDVASSVEADAVDAGIELRVGPVPAALVACSRGVYLSLLGNLVRNALKYIGEAPTRRITISARVEGDRVRTEVEDTGPGVPATVLPALFEPYFRATSDVRKEGLGLGLATVKRLAEGHGGQVGATSEQGRGSTFWFTLPWAGVAEEPHRSLSPSPGVAAQLAPQPPALDGAGGAGALKLAQGSSLGAASVKKTKS